MMPIFSMPFEHATHEHTHARPKKIYLLYKSTYKYEISQCVNDEYTQVRGLGVNERNLYIIIYIKILRCSKLAIITTKPNNNHSVRR